VLSAALMPVSRRAPRSRIQLGRDLPRFCAAAPSMTAAYCSGMRLPVIAVIILTPITLAMVLAGSFSIEWGFVHITFVGFDHAPRTLDLTIGLRDARLQLHSSGRLMIQEEKAFSELASRLAHLPVLRQHAKFERAGIAARVALWLSQLAFVGLLLYGIQQLFCGASDSQLQTVLGLAAMQGLCGAAGPALWAILIPGVGVGHTYHMELLWAFQATLVTCCLHLLCCVGLSIWAYKTRTQQYRFEKLPTSSNDEAPRPDSAVAPVDIELEMDDT